MQRKLDMTQSGTDPNDFESWRKEVFAAVLATRSGERFSGASLAYDRGTMDFEILKDSECPEEIAAICPMTTFLGANFMVPLTKGQAYAYLDAWNAAGRPDVYQWPQAVAGHPANPVAIAANDPCRALRPKETLTAGQRARMNQEGRHTEWKPYRRCVEAAFAIMQANMTESMRQELTSEPEYLAAVSAGDLLGMLNQTKRKAICGHRILSNVIHDAISRVTGPTGEYLQLERETDAEYALRFRRLVDAAHGLRALNNSVLTEEACIEGYLLGIRPAFQQVKLQWQNIRMFASLNDAMTRVKATGQSMMQNEAKSRSLSSTMPSAQADSESIKRKADGPESPKQARFRPFRRTYSSPMSNSYLADVSAGRVLITEETEFDELESEVFTADQVQRIVRDSVLATQALSYANPAQQPYFHPNYNQYSIFNTQSAPTSGYGSLAWPEQQVTGQMYAYGSPVFVTNQGPRLGGLQGRPKAVSECRYFAANQSCPYGEACRFVHGQPIAKDPTQSATGGGLTPSNNAIHAPAINSRTNPFAARPNN